MKLTGFECLLLCVTISCCTVLQNRPEFLLAANAKFAVGPQQVILDSAPRQLELGRYTLLVQSGRNQASNLEFTAGQILDIGAWPVGGSGQLRCLENCRRSLSGPVGR